MPRSSKLVIPRLRLLAWEMTRACNLACRYCRAKSGPRAAPDELTHVEAMAVVEDLPALGRPILILTGGEPLLREDVLEIASRASDRRCRVVMGTNGSLLDDATVRRLKDAGVRRISVTIDGAIPEEHDNLRGMPGAFNMALRGIGAAQRGGLSFQINTTVSRLNRGSLTDIGYLAARLGAAAWHPFLLVPTGRAEGRTNEELSAEEYEETLTWLAELEQKLPLKVKVTCAPHFQRVKQQRPAAHQHSGRHHGLDIEEGGCLGGQSFCFLSSEGNVQPCGYLPAVGGNVREKPLPRIWAEAEIFRALRNRRRYKGKCGLCRYVKVCGGCRARAFAATGDYLAEEPLCVYSPPH